jgi:hypothetical protein
MGKDTEEDFGGGHKRMWRRTDEERTRARMEEEEYIHTSQIFSRTTWPNG